MLELSGVEVRYGAVAAAYLGESAVQEADGET